LYGKGTTIFLNSKNFNKAPCLGLFSLWGGITSQIQRKKQKKHKEKTNYIQTHIHLIFNYLRTFAYNNIVFYVQRKNSTITQN
jgi:hypothetical protein